jgi:large subunit ribosomal protein L30e
LPISLPDLERQLKAATRTGKVTVGRKEVANSLKGTRLLVWSASANLPQELLSQSKSLEIPAVRFDGNPIELGRIAGFPFKVSVLSVKSVGDAKLDPFTSSQDYTVRSVPGFMQTEPHSQEENEQQIEEAPKKKAKKTDTKRKTAKKEEAAKEEPKTKAKKTSRRSKNQDEDDKSATKSEPSKERKASKKKEAKQPKKKKASKKESEVEPSDEGEGEED